MKKSFVSGLLLLLACACGGNKSSEESTVQSCSKELISSKQAISKDLADLKDLGERFPGEGSYQDDIESFKTDMLLKADQVNSKITDFEKAHKGTICLSEKLVNANDEVASFKTKLKEAKKNLN